MELHRRWIGRGHPRLLIESHGVDDESVALPLARGMAEERGSQCIARGMWTPIHVNHAPGMRACDVEHEDRLEFRNFHELKTGCEKKRWSAARFAIGLRRIEIGLRSTILIQRSSPW